MKKNCENCKQNNETVSATIPYFAHESAMTRAERHIKRMWIALIVCIMLIFASNALWLWIMSSTEFYIEEVTLDSQDGGNANYIGQDGDIYNGTNSSSEN